MKTFPIAIMLLPCALLCAQELPIKSTITVERGIYKKGWERDFFREAAREPGAAEGSDALAALTDTDAARPDNEPPRSPRPAPPHRGREPLPQPAASSAAPAAEVEESPDAAPERAPEPPAPRPPETRRPAPTPAPAATPQVSPQEETQPAIDPEEPNKKQKERARELEKRRKKGNFRDPKITY